MESITEESKYEIREEYLTCPSLSYPHIDLAPTYDFQTIEKIAKEK